MTDQAQAPKFGNFTKFFVPGLAIGIAIGGVCGAYFSSRLEAPAPVLTSSGAPRTTQRRDEGPRAAPQAAPGESGATAPSAPSGASTPSGATGATK